MRKSRRIREDSSFDIPSRFRGSAFERFAGFWLPFVVF